MAYGLGRDFPLQPQVLRQLQRYRPLEENPRYNLESTGSLPEPSGASLEMAVIFFGSGDCPPGPERLPVLED
jgi:hypothetical protein